MYAKGMHPGAVWKKCDFQIHTPRDGQWSGSDHLQGGTSPEEQAREDWADGFVAKCVEKGLGAIAITDHHDFCFVEYVRGAIARLEDPSKRPWLFPGIEVTCDDAVQCLVLFDSTTDAATWNRLFGGHLNNVAAPDPNAATNPPAEPCGRQVEDFLKSVASDVQLNQSSIVLPHASNEGAHKSMLRTGFHVRFKQLPFDGVYTDKAFDELDDVTKKKIYGQIPQWGNRRRGIIPTGDNRKQSFDRLGNHTCWIRLGEPTTEAIRQAVLADEARIAYEEPSLPNHRLLELHISSTLTGPNFKLSFNDGFTALIGGRGSGKSAILEYLRFGLGRSSADTGREGEEGPSREQSLIADTLKEGSVTIFLLRDGIVEQWHRTGARRDTITVTLADDSTEELTVPAAQQRFRARAFYQKQLSTLVKDRRRAGEQITGIAAAESVDRRRIVEQQIGEAKREVQTAFQQLVEFWVAEADHNQSINSIADLNRRIDAVKKRLEDSGVTPENQKLLDAAPAHNLANALVREADLSIASDIAKLREAFATVPSIDSQRWSAAGSFEEVETFLSALSTARERISESLTGAIEALEALAAAQKVMANDFKTRRDAFVIRHRAAAEEQAGLKSIVEESQKLLSELEAAETTERRTAAKVKTLERAPQALTEARTRLLDRLDDRRTVLQEAATKVQSMSHDSLRAEVRGEQVPRQYVEALLAICEGHHMRDLDARCEDRVRELVDPQINGWPTVNRSNHRGL